MFSQYFGHYLLNKGLISAAQLKDALDLQATTHVKLGVLSVNEGFMTASQVEEVHEKQKQVDKRFGEIAIELGYLTEQQLEQLLSGQKQNHLILGQALVDRNYMSIEEFSNALAAYKKDNSLSDAQFEAIKSGDIDTLIDTLLDIKDTSNKQSYSDYVSLFAKNLIRFIDDQVRLEAKPIADNYNAKWFSSQKIKGEGAFTTAIGCDNDEVLLKFASIYAEETLTEVDELAKASIDEFLNLHNGIFTVNMSNRQIELTMDPPKTEQNVTIAKENIALIVTAYMSFGAIDIIIYN